MGIFNFTSKEKNENRRVRFSHIDGLNALYGKGTVIDLTLNKEKGILEISAPLSKSKGAVLELEKIVDVNVMNEKEIIEKQKSVIGRAALGSLLGPLGAVVGGMSGIGSKKASESHIFVIINYQSDDQSKKIAIEVIGASVGWDKLVKEISPPKATKSQNSGPVNL